MKASKLDLFTDQIGTKQVAKSLKANLQKKFKKFAWRRQFHARLHELNQIYKIKNINRIMTD